MIRMTIEIGIAPIGLAANEFGASVLVYSDLSAGDIPDGVGATFAGISTAINDYMRSRGCPDFDCLKRAYQFPQPPKGPSSTGRSDE